MDKVIKAFALATLLFSPLSYAALLDFTNSSTTYTGSVDGVGYTLSTNTGSLNSSEGYDGWAWTGCSPSSLTCQVDGVGINNDEVQGQEVLTLTFDSAVKISAFYFLDVYTSQVGTEKVDIKIDGVYFNSVFGSETHYMGGYKALENLSVLAQVIEFSAPLYFNDDYNNDFALAGVEVSAVPVPAAAFLFAPALLGFMGLRRKAAKA